MGAKFSEYRDASPESSVPGERWRRQVDIALGWIHSKKLRKKPVSMLCEIQCVLKKYRDVRFKMHEAYKINRATDTMALYNDFKNIRVEMDRKKCRKNDGATPEYKACRDNDFDGIYTLVEINDGRLDNLDYCLVVASRYGSAKTLQELLKVKNAKQSVVQQAGLLLKEAIEMPDNYRTKARTVEVLLEAKADVNALGEEDSTSLYRAAKGGHLDVVKVLIQGKATIDAPIRSGATALF